MNRTTRALAVVAGLLLLYVLSIIAMQRLFTSVAPGANDFYPRWKGAQDFWTNGTDPYSDSTSEAIQMDIYGRLAEPDEDQLLFVYPFYTVFLLLPLVWLPLSYSWIQAIWLVTLQFALIGSMILTIRLTAWRMPLWLLALTLLWSAIFYNSARTIILGQFSALVFLFVAGTLVALKAGRDLPAGILLALTTVKPQMVFLFIPALVIWALGQKRWRFLASLSAAIVLLLGLSTLLLPTWIGGFVDQMRSYPAYTVTPPPLWVITGHYFPQLGKPVEQGLAVLLLVYLLSQWRKLPRLAADSDQLLIILGLTLVISNMIVVRTATTNFVVFYIPLVWGLKQMSARLPKGNLLVALFYLLSTFLMWGLFLMTIQGDFEHPVMYLPLPLGLLAMLIWVKPAAPAPLSPHPPALPE